jgi:hypothetical protein
MEAVLAVPLLVPVPKPVPVPLFALLLRLGETEEAAVAVVPASREVGVLETSRTAPLFGLAGDGDGDAKASLSLISLLP